MKNATDKKDGLEDISFKKLKRSQKERALKEQKEKNKREEEKALKASRRSRKRKAEKSKNRKKRSGKNKEEIFVPVLSLVFAAIFFILGACSWYYDKIMTEQCTAEITGVVVRHGEGRLSNVDPVAGKYAPSQVIKIGRKRVYWRDKIRRKRVYWREIKVETDGKFRHKTLYAATNAGNEGDEVIIRYDPDDPDEYYIESSFKEEKGVMVFFFVVCGSMIVLSIYLFIHYNIPQPSDKKKA